MNTVTARCLVEPEPKPMVEADEGVAVIPYFGQMVFRNRKIVMSRLINPVIEAEFHQISNRGKKLPLGADEFVDFLKSFFTRST